MAIYRCAACGQLNRVGTPPGGEPVCGACKRPLDTAGAPQEVDAAGLREAVARSPVPVVVDVWAPWCGPCRQAAPLLDALARQHKGELLVLKVNGDDHPEASASLGVQGIPTFVAFRGGREVSRQVGLPPKDAFARWVGAQVAGS